MLKLKLAFTHMHALVALGWGCIPTSSCRLDKLRRVDWKRGEGGGGWESTQRSLQSQPPLMTQMARPSVEPSVRMATMPAKVKAQCLRTLRSVLVSPSIATDIILTLASTVSVLRQERRCTCKSSFHQVLQATCVPSICLCRKPAE